MKTVVTIAAAVILLLEVMQSLTNTDPFGGDHIAQIGIVFGLSIAFAQIYDGLRKVALNAREK